VLYNFVSNAIKFTPDDGRVTVRARPEGDLRFRLEVEDTGVGVAPADLDRLFVEFQQLDAGAAKQHPGTGLGLALTRRLVDAQGGHVGVRSAPGAGSVFFAVLPRAPAARGHVQAAAGIAPLLSPRADAPAVLVVEDEPRDAAWLARTLLAAGYAVQVAATVAEALRLTAERAWAAITLDLLLPDGSGLDVLKRIRAGGPCRDAPVIVVSASAERHVAAAFQVADILAKPVADEELLAALGRAGVVARGGRKVLCVDASEESLEQARAALARLGFAAVCTGDAQAALAAAEREAPAVLVVDLVLKNGDSFVFLEQFRRDPRRRGVPVIVWTARDPNPAERAKLAALVQAVVAKGAGGAEALLEQLRVILGKPEVPPDA